MIELAAALKPSGHAIQARLYAEDPGRDFQPCPGLLTAVEFPPADRKALRIDTWVEAGCEIPPYFEPMIAKLIAWAPTREQASAGLDQFVGRTLQMWNRYREVEAFDGKPWLLRLFDQVRFYPVGADELLRIRRDFPLGRYPLRIEHSELRLAEYQYFLTGLGLGKVQLEDGSGETGFICDA